MIVPARAMFDAALLDLSLTALAAALFMAWQARGAYAIDQEEGRQLLPVWSGAALAGLVGAVVGGDPLTALITTLVCLFGATLLGWAMPRLSVAGALSLVVQPLMLIVALPWSLVVMADLGYPVSLLAAWAVIGSIGLVLAGFTLVGSLVRQAIMTHVEWTRPTRPALPKTGPDAPMISVQVACYAEPPELVIATLDRIAAQNYANFEVMVCDNNTPDEMLWRPVEAHCRRLNAKLGFDRFRFFHVAPLEGAKAGALNWMAPKMNPKAELIAILDADYEAEPDFLSRLAGFFDDPKIGYVQTPHDYRAYQDSLYLRACYWEYMPTNKVVYPGINEYNAAFTIGTMCVLRADAIRDAGGWAEWCLTEDSEISVRIRALGYDGIYLPHTFGRGLIPETFEDYRKQRFRWTAGPVQQLRRYWRLFLPGRLAQKSDINGWSKLLEVQRCASPLIEGVMTAIGLTTMVGVALLSAVDVLPNVVLPGVAWPVLFASLATTLVLTWRRYRLTGTSRISDMLLGELAKASLSYVQMTAAVAGLSSKPRPWTRTPKFAAKGSWQRAFTATRQETAIAGAHVALILLLLGLSPQIGGHLTTVGVVGLMLSGARFLAAPAMALLGERELARQEERDAVASFAPVQKQGALNAA